MNAIRSREWLADLSVTALPHVLDLTSVGSVEIALALVAVVVRRVTIWQKPYLGGRRSKVDATADKTRRDPSGIV
jgi:hypothetical protein